MGLGSIIVFIALLVGVTIWAGMAYQEGTDAKDAAGATGSSTQKHIRTSVTPVSAQAAMDSDGDYTHLQVIIESPPASDPINLEGLMLKLESDDYNIPIAFRGEGAPIENSADGFSTRTEREDEGRTGQEIGDIGVYREEEHDNIGVSYVDLTTVDFDLDGIDDRVKLCGKNECPINDDGKHLYFNLSTGVGIYILMTNATGGAIEDICQFKNEGNNVVAMNMTPIGNYGYLNLSGTLCEDCCIIEDAVSNMTYYQNRTPLTQDLDDDGDASDYLYVNTTHALFFYSSYGKKTVPFQTSIASPTTIGVTSQLTHGGYPFAEVNISGTTQYENIIDAPVSFTIYDHIEPMTEEAIQSYYVAESLDGKGTAGVATLDDNKIRLHIELPSALSDPATLRFLPQSGMQSTMRLSPPVAMSGNAVALYP